MPPTSPGGRSSSRRGFALLTFGVLTALGLWRLPGPVSSQTSATDSLPVATVSVSSVPEAVAVDPKPPAPSVVGVWEDNFYGKRRMTFQDDGTATMEIELDPVSRLIYGPKLLFHINWKQEGDRLILQMTGGEPAEVTKTLGKLFGETSEQTIESLTTDEMRLRSRDSGKLYVHRRIAEPSGGPATGGVE